MPRRGPDDDGRSRLDLGMYGQPETKIRRLVDACVEHGLALNAQKAYALATVEHETGGTFDPVREGHYLGSRAESWRRSLVYFPFYGRGYVQITWRANYAKFSKLLGVDLVANPDLVMEPERAAWIMAYGFKHGSFTGRKMEDYITATRCDFRNARRCINALDRADHIAGLARAWLARKELLA